VKKAQQRLFLLRKLKQAGLPPELLGNFYRSVIESILCQCGAPAAQQRTGGTWPGWFGLHRGLREFPSP